MNATQMMMMMMMMYSLLVLHVGFTSADQASGFEEIRLQSPFADGNFRRVFSQQGAH